MALLDDYINGREILRDDLQPYFALVDSGRFYRSCTEGASHATRGYIRSFLNYITSQRNVAERARLSNIRRFAVKQCDAVLSRATIHGNMGDGSLDCITPKQSTVDRDCDKRGDYSRGRAVSADRSRDTQGRVLED